MKIWILIFSMLVFSLLSCNNSKVDDDTNSCSYEEEYRIELCNSNEMDNCTEIEELSTDFELENLMYVTEVSNSTCSGVENILRPGSAKIIARSGNSLFIKISASSEGKYYVLNNNEIIYPNINIAECNKSYSRVGGRISSYYNEIYSYDVVELKVNYSVEYDPNNECGE